MYFNRLLILLCFLASYQSAAHNTKLTFNRPADTPQAKYVLELLKIAYDEVGYQLELVDFNQGSAIIAANEGVLDGQLGKVPGLSPQFPNLTKINVPLFSFNLQLISRCSNCSLQELQSLAVQSNYQAASQYLNTTHYSGHLLQIKSTPALLNLLLQDQVSAALVIDFYIQPYQQRLIDAGIQFNNIKTINTYHYLHKKHQHLIPKLTLALNKLHNNGTMSRLKKKYQL